MAGAKGISRADTVGGALEEQWYHNVAANNRESNKEKARQEIIAQWVQFGMEESEDEKEKWTFHSAPRRCWHEGYTISR